MLDAAASIQASPLVSLVDLTERVSTINPAAKVPFDQVTYVDLSAIDQDTKKIVAGQSLLGKEAPSRARQLIREGDVLVSTVRPNLNGVALVPKQYTDSIASTGFCVLRSRTELLHGAYLFHWVRSRSFVDAMVSKATGASYPAVSDAVVRKSTIPCPPLPQQRRIAAILDQADALRAKRRTALAQLDEMAQAIFVEMFGTPYDWSARWSLRPFLEVMTDQTAKANRLPASSFERNGLYPVVDQGQQKFAGYFSDPSYLCPSPLPCIIFGDHTRSVKLVLKPFIVGADGAKVLVPAADIDPAFLSFVLRMAPIPDLGYSRHMRELKRMLFPAPPIELQTLFANRVGEVGKQKNKVERAMVMLDNLFSSLQHRAFTGAL